LIIQSNLVVVIAFTTSPESRI